MRSCLVFMLCHTLDASCCLMLKKRGRILSPEVKWKHLNGPTLQVTVCLCSLNTEQLLLKTHQEHLNFLTKERTGVGKKYVIAKLGDNVSFCANYCAFGVLHSLPWPQLIVCCHSFWNLSLQRDDCIRHALNAQGITATDPKVAVTDNFLCTGGRTPERDHIACTGMVSLIQV